MLPCYMVGFFGMAGVNYFLNILEMFRSIQEQQQNWNIVSRTLIKSQKIRYFLLIQHLCPLI